MAKIFVITTMNAIQSLYLSPQMPSIQYGHNFSANRVVLSWGWGVLYYYSISSINTFQLTRISVGGLVMVGKTYTQSAGKSPRRPLRTHSPKHHPEFMTTSPLSCSRIIRSPFWKLRKEELSPGKIERKGQDHKLLSK